MKDWQEMSSTGYVAWVRHYWIVRYYLLDVMK